MDNLSQKAGKLKGVNKKFIKNMVDSASPTQLIVLLYEGALQWLHMAKQEIKKNNEAELPNWSNYANYMGMALEILTHLQDSLDHSQAEDFADKMFSLYDFMKTELGNANAFKQEEKIDNVVDLLKDLKDTWKQAMKNNAAPA